MLPVNQKLSRIGVFYDGNFFRRIGSFYNAAHPKRARISIEGLHNFIRHRVANEEGTDVKFTQIVDAHYFKGRMKAREAEERDILYYERSFEDVLMYEGITTHFLPKGKDGEKGIDVWLALEAFEMAIYKRFDVLVLIAGDADFVPLVRKLTTIGTRVMLLGWDFSYVDNNGITRETKTSNMLLNEVSYPIRMEQLIDDPENESNEYVQGLFYRRELRPEPQPEPRQEPRPAAIFTSTFMASNVPEKPPEGADLQWGRILNLKETYGFIQPEDGGPENVFFPFSALPTGDPQRLLPGMRVSYEFVRGDRGPLARKVWILLNQD